MPMTKVLLRGALLRHFGEVVEKGAGGAWAANTTGTGVVHIEFDVWLDGGPTHRPVTAGDLLCDM
jgi:hypothetical protein